jgi:hypothetical protein
VFPFLFFPSLLLVIPGVHPELFAIGLDAFADQAVKGIVAIAVTPQIIQIADILRSETHQPDADSVRLQRICRRHRDAEVN